MGDYVTMFIFAGLLTAAVATYLIIAGRAADAAKRRRLLIIRDRHTASAKAVVEAQLRRITGARATRMDGVAARLLPNSALLRKRIAMTGRDWSPGRYLTANLLIMAVVAAAVLFQGGPFLLALFLGSAVGLGLPHFVISSLIKRRIAKFNKKFPDAIELLVRGLRSGLPISETLTVVATEIPGPVGVEFRNVSDRIKIGRTMDAALQETADRLETPEFQFFCITLAIQRETGGNLAETLSNLSEVLRKRAQMKLKVKAMSSESKASAYIIGALPFIVFGLIWTINDQYMQSFFTNPMLIAVGLGGVVWMAIGAFIMSKMISFEI